MFGKHHPLRSLAQSTTWRRVAATSAGAALTVAGLAVATAPAQAANGVPQYDHVVLVMEENHSYDEVIGNSSAPYINNTLAAGGALFSQSFAIEHPSEPNYLDLFSGDNQGVTDDSCPHTFSTANEAAQLLAAGKTWDSYSEGLPSAGSTVCTSGAYARKHNPWVNFSNVPSSTNLPFTSFPSSANFSSLPTVSWVVPNLNNDMHDGTVAQGDTWLQNNIDAYAQWAKTHNSLLIVTWDEDDSSMSNQVPTLFYGANVKQGTYSETINHYNVLRTIEDMYGLPYAGAASSATPITDVFNTTPVETVSVTNPGNQTSTAGTAISTLQISATDSQGKALTYSATGLPAGLSISSSGAVTGTPTTAGTSTVVVTASSGTASGTTQFTWTVNPQATETVSVTNPGDQTSTVGTAISTLQIHATDSAGKALTYSATGLPAGLAISSSGAITGTPTATGTSNVTVTASSGTASGSTSFSWTVNPQSTETVSVTNPGNQTSTVGTAIGTLQIHATDSAGKALTYSATGLPAGLSISSSGAITGTPTTAGTSSVTVTASSGTASGSTQFSWTVNPVSGGCTAAQLLGNPGFETGSATPWTATSGVINSDTTSEPAHSGGWDAWLDGYGSTHTDTLAQKVTIPASCATATFSFYLHIDTDENTTTTAYDKLNVQVLNSSGTVVATLATYSNLNAAGGYVSHSFSLAPYIGQTISLKFTGTEDSSAQTSFVVDDTALNVN